MPGKQSVKGRETRNLGYRRWQLSNHVNLDSLPCRPDDLGSPPGSAEAHRTSRDECVGVVSPDSLHDGTFDEDTRGHVFPQRHEQLPCKGDDGCLFEAPPLIAHYAFVEPAGMRRTRLIAQPQPGQCRRLSGTVLVCFHNHPRFGPAAGAAPDVRWSGFSDGDGGGLTDRVCGPSLSAAQSKASTEAATFRSPCVRAHSARRPGPTIFASTITSWE